MDQESNPPPALPMANVPAMTPRKKSRWWLWLLLGGGGLVAIVLVCAGGFTWMYFSGKSTVEVVVNAFQAKLEAEDYSGAYQSIGPEFRAAIDEESFTEFESAVLERLGKIQSKTMSGFNFQDGTRQGYAEISYNVVFENAQGSVTYILTNSTGTWRVISHRVDSTAMIELLTCPKCGKVADTWADYCGECGAKMNH